MAQCDLCNGRGEEVYKDGCPKCKATGDAGQYGGVAGQNCDRCRGKGKVAAKRTCTKCGGSGEL